MLTKLPIISSPAGVGEILNCAGRVRGDPAREGFSAALGAFTRAKYIYPANSGITSFYIILRALSRMSPKREVILPAYTAGSLVVAVRKAGLRPVLCDISLKDFNMDVPLLAGLVSDRTLAVVPVHSFGINVRGIENLRSEVPGGVFLIEDCAQSMGSRTNGKESGSFGDAAFFSFNRGKNLPASGGGCVTTNDRAIAAGLDEEVLALEEEGAIAGLSAPLKALAFSVASKPVLYGTFFFLISRFKETAPPKDFAVKRMNYFQARLGLRLLKRAEDYFARRHQNGISLIEGLRDAAGIIIPEIPAEDRYAFNRLPVLFKDPAKRELAAKRLWAGGIEASRMYVKSLHRMFDLGYDGSEFPNAVYCADRLLALPTHPSVDGGSIARIVKIIKEVAAR